MDCYLYKNLLENGDVPKMGDAIKNGFETSIFDIYGLFNFKHDSNGRKIMLAVLQKE